jgi:predicted MFS family arabinose efflux permease
MPSTDGEQPTPRLFPALAEPLVRRYFIGQSISVLGSWIQNITLNLLCWQLTGSPALLGVINFVLFGPSVLVTPIVGPRVQPGNARRLTLLAVGGSLLVTMALVALSASGAITVALMVGLALAKGLLGALEGPARQVLLTTAVTDPTRIANAVAMNTVAYNAARMIGPAIAAAVFATLGATAAFAMTALALAVMLVSVLRLPIAAGTGIETDAPAQHASLRSAIAYVRNDRLARLFLPVSTCLALLGSSYQTLVPVLADHVYGSANTWTGLFFAAAGAGSTAAALLLSSRFLFAASRRLQVVTPWTVVVALAGLGTTGTPAIAMLCFAVLGFSLTFTGPGTNAKLQQNAPPGLRGALVGLYAMSFVGAIPLGNLMIGSLAQWLSVKGSFLAMSGVLAVLLGILFVPRWIARGRIVFDADEI